MDKQARFVDEQLTIADFYNEVLVVCPSCSGRAIAIIDQTKETARLTCTSCGYSKEVPTRYSYAPDGKRQTGIPDDSNSAKSKTYLLVNAAHTYFNAELWLQAPFKEHNFWAYNHKHLNYLKRYIAASLRESVDRSHFTLVEKLPKFIQAAGNRQGLLKIIEQLEKK